MFGLSGSHRSGKTTLAKLIAANLGIDFLETNLSSVFAAHGVDAKDDLPFAKRMEIQEEMMRLLEIKYGVRTKPFIADRTPFDVLGYTVSEVHRGTMDDAMRDRYRAHLIHGLRIVTQSLRAIMVLDPLVNPTDAAGKAQACPVYMAHVDACIRAMIDQAGPLLPADFYVQPVYVQDLGEREAQSVAYFKQFLPTIEVPKLWTPGG